MVKTLFLDIGGVFMTNGWGHESRRRAAATFQFDFEEAEAYHRTFYNTYEQGKLSLEEYLDLYLFHTKRSFTKSEFIRFMYGESRPHQEMLSWLKAIKEKFSLRLCFVSNEGREIAEHRLRLINSFSLIDVHVISGFVGLQKPDPAIYRLAFDLTQAKKEESLYLDDRKELVEAASLMGIVSLVHTSCVETQKTVQEWLESKE